MRYIKLFENFEIKDDIIEKIKSLEYILKDENLQIHRYGSRFDNSKNLTISLRLTSDIWHTAEDIVREDFFLEYIDRVEQLCQDEKVFDTIDCINIRVNGNTFVFIDRNGQW